MTSSMVIGSEIRHVSSFSRMLTPEKGNRHGRHLLSA